MPKVTGSLLNSDMEWRCIGPFRGGRVVAVAGDPSNRNVFYFGACAGGLWKTYDGGTYWENVSDNYFNTAAVGAIGLSESDPNVIYAGTGEACIRGDVSHGDGIYRSSDAGQTWVHVGLGDTRHIARIRVHPSNPDLVYVAALGHAFGPNQQRGVFMSRNGGKSWAHVLFKSDKAGAIDLSIDPNNPRILYAAIYQVLRTPWSLISGGPDTGLYKSTDGGETWDDLTSSPGMPEGTKGRMGLAVSPAKEGRIWAIVEAEEGALLRSDDYGESWESVCKDTPVRQRPFYHHHIFAHPEDAETVYVLAVQAWKSSDGGRTFTITTSPHSDHHDLWIDPNEPERMIQGNDGGACVSFNGGETWSTIYNQPTSQFYHVTTDTRTPYHVYGTQQDNTAISVPSQSPKRVIMWEDCYPVGASESGYIAVRPDNPNIVYSGAMGSGPGGGGVLLRYDHDTNQTRIITVWPEIFYGKGSRDHKYRFQWTFPIIISPHDPSILYTTGNHVFKSSDEGSSWEIISPDLTRNDATKGEPGGGPISRDVAGCEHYCTIFSFAESIHEQGVLWTGSDDGLVHISRDCGVSWNNITPSSLPEWATVSMIEPSPHNPAVAYLSAIRYKLDDYHPYLYRTNDYGASWQNISSGIPANEFTRIVREDPVRPGLLFVGTETRVYVSTNDGATWEPLQLNMPVTPIHDLVVKEGDLIAATHGRSFWILDDLTPLREPICDEESNGAHLFRPRQTYRRSPLFNVGARERVGTGKNYHPAAGIAAAYYEIQSRGGQLDKIYLDAGKDCPDGALINYYLRDQPDSEISLTFIGQSGDVVGNYTSTDGGPLTAHLGTNRFVWDMRYPGSKVTKEGTDPTIAGPLVTPGNYKVELRQNDTVQTQTLAVRLDPGIDVTLQDLEAQLELHIRIRDKYTETMKSVGVIRNIRSRVAGLQSRDQHVPNRDGVAILAHTIDIKLDAVERELVPVETHGERDQMGRPHPQLSDALAALTSVISSSDAAPTQQSYEVFDHLSTRIDTELYKLQQVIDQEVAALSTLTTELDVL